jgi:hypothetical protein
MRVKLSTNTINQMMQMFPSILATKDTHPRNYVLGKDDYLRKMDRTHVEWPKENHVPTVTGLCPAATNRLVIRSIAFKHQVSSASVCTVQEIHDQTGGTWTRKRTEIWSASRAWRRPRVYARIALEVSVLNGDASAYAPP